MNTKHLHLSGRTTLCDGIEAHCDCRDGFYAPVETLKGEFVKRKSDARKVYRVVGYCRINRKYQLDDCDDISRAIFVKRGTPVFAGFTY
jgi:hypothetical protein